MRVLVTGASGFIGRAVVAELARRGHQVDRLSRDATDVADSQQVMTAVAASGADAAVLLGWDATPGRYLHDEAGNLTSLNASRHVLRALRASACERVVIAGTCLEQLEAEGGGSSTPYGRAKRLLHEEAAELADRDFGVACGHIFWLYGPHEHPGRAVAAVVSHLLRGEPIDVTAGTQERDLLHVDDVSAGLCQLLETVEGFEQVDICSGHQVPMRAVFELIGAIIDRPELIRFGARPTTSNDDFVVLGDPGRLRTKGWRPRWSLDQGLRQTIGWWREELTREAEVRS